MIVQRIAPEAAAEALTGLEQLDPRGMCAPGDLVPMCQAGECYELQTGEGGRAVIVITRANGVVWIDAAAGGGGVDLCASIHDLVRQLGGRSIAFQTARRGLVDRAQRLGYRQTGYIMRFDL
jgi:hypothetical protein